MSGGIVSRFSHPGAREWLHQKTYASLSGRDEVAWAEEWLRRSAGFRRALKTLPCRSRRNVSVIKDDIRYTRCNETCPLSALGVGCCMVDKNEPTVLWLPGSNPHVLSVTAKLAPRRNGGQDLRECAFLKGVFQKGDGSLNLLVSGSEEFFKLCLCKLEIIIQVLSHRKL